MPIPKQARFEDSLEVIIVHIYSVVRVNNVAYTTWCIFFKHIINKYNACKTEYLDVNIMVYKNSLAVKKKRSQVK